MIGFFPLGKEAHLKVASLQFLAVHEGHFVARSNHHGEGPSGACYVFVSGY